MQTEMSEVTGLTGPSPYINTNIAASSNEVAGLRSILIGELNLRAFVHGILVFDMVTAPLNLFSDQPASNELQGSSKHAMMGWAAHQSATQCGSCSVHGKCKCPAC